MQAPLLPQFSTSLRHVHFSTTQAPLVFLAENTPAQVP